MKLNYRQGDASNTKLFAIHLDHDMGSIFVDQEHLIVTSYLGKATNPTTNYRFKDSEALMKHVKETIEKFKRIKQSRIDRRAERVEWARKANLEFFEKVKVGSVLYDTWGYEQTNVEFYQVLAIKGSKVLIKEIGHEQVGEATSWASCNVMPAIDPSPTQGGATWKIVKGGGVRINSSVCLRPWHGKALHKSWYA